MRRWGLLLLSVAAVLTPAADQPNVLVIVSDDHNWTDYGFMGHPHINTPELDRLAAESITFTRGYTPVPLCRPSLATMVTGRFPHEHGVIGNDPLLPGTDINPQRGRNYPETLPRYEEVVANFQRFPNFIQQLTAKGYLTLQTGKWWEADPKVTADFTHAMTTAKPPRGRHGDKGLTIGRHGLQPIEDVMQEARDADKPWMVWYAPFLPHAPHTPPEDLLAKYLPLAPTEAIARYWACVEWFDQTIGNLRELTTTYGGLENTIVLYWCDNGWIQQPDNINKYDSRSKRTAYEAGVRTPIMVGWPGHLEPRMERTHLASTIDLWPTLAALLDTGVPPELSGINLTDTPALAARTAITGERYLHHFHDTNHPPGSLLTRWIIDDVWKLLVNETDRPTDDPMNAQSKHRFELFNLETDPYETTNVAAQYPDRVRDLASQLDAWWDPSAE